MPGSRDGAGPAAVPVEGAWDGSPGRWGRAPEAVLRPTVVDRRELDGGGVCVPLRPMPRWAPLLLLVVGAALVGVFVAALVAMVRGPVRAGAPVGLLLLGLLALLGAAFLAAVPSTVRATRGGRRWLLTPTALVTTSVTVPWHAIASVQRQTLAWPGRYRTGTQHLLSVGLRADVEPDDLPGIAESPFASAVLSRTRRRTGDRTPDRVIALGDVRLLGVDPERLAQAIALLASRPDLRERLVDERGVRLVESGSADATA